MKKQTKVKGYTKHVNGKTVNVKESKREYESAEDIAKDAIKKAKGAGNELKKKQRLEELSKLSDDELMDMDDLTFDELQEVYKYKKNNKGGSGKSSEKKSGRDDDSLIRYDDDGKIKDAVFYIDKDLMKKDLEKDKKRRVMKYDNPEYQNLKNVDSDDYRRAGTWRESDSDDDTPKNYSVHKSGQKGMSYYEKDKHVGDFKDHSELNQFKKDRRASFVSRLMEKAKQVKDFLKEIGKSEVPYHKAEAKKETPAERTKALLQKHYEEGEKQGYYKKNRKGEYKLTSKGYEEILRRRMERNKNK